LAIWYLLRPVENSSRDGNDPNDPAEINIMARPAGTAFPLFSRCRSKHFPYFDVFIMSRNSCGSLRAFFFQKENKMKKSGLNTTLTLALGAVILLAGFLPALADVKKIPQRSEIEEKYKWKLEHIYADTLAWLADYNRLESQMSELESFKGRLGESAEVLYDCLQLQDSLNIILGRLYVYAFMKQDEDTRISEYQQLGGKIGWQNKLS
jgi:hypothetical protein